MILIGVAVVMAVLGILLQSGKASFLISGYNTMSMEQQAQVDIRGLSRLMAVYMYFLTGIFLLMALFEWLNWPNAMIGCVVVLLISTVIIVWKSQKFYAQVTSKVPGKFGKNAKWSILISIVTVIGAGGILYGALQPVAMIVENDELTIGGIYGDTFAVAGLEEVALIDDLPAISMRTNGSAVGSKLQGHFKLENGDKVKLFVDKSKPPFITFVAGSKRYYMNDVSARKTTELFEQLVDGH